MKKQALVGKALAGAGKYLFTGPMANLTYPTMLGAGVGLGLHQFGGVPDRQRETSQAEYNRLRGAWQTGAGITGAGMGASLGKAIGGGRGAIIGGALGGLGGWMFGGGHAKRKMQEILMNRHLAQQARMNQSPHFRAVQF